MSVATLIAWRNLPGFWGEVYAEARSIIGDAVPDILMAIAKEAKRGDVAAAKLCLQCLGVFEAKSGVKLDVTEPLVFILSGQGGQDQKALPDRKGEFALEADYKILETVNATAD